MIAGDVGAFAHLPLRGTGGWILLSVCAATLIYIAIMLWRVGR